MGGDLNLKKSWHPVLMSNQRRVWEEEKKALDERKRIDQMIKERQEERQIQDLQQMQEAAGGKKRIDRVNWMYSGPSSGQNGTTEEMEGYLLGKRRIDGLLKGTETKKLEKAATEESFMALQNANTVRDTASKVREDPMLAIKRQEQAAYEAMMNDPVRRRQLLKAAGADDQGKPTKRKGSTRHHREDSRRAEDDDRRHRHKRRRHNEHHRREDKEYNYRRVIAIHSAGRLPPTHTLTDTALTTGHVQTALDARRHEARDHFPGLGPELVNPTRGGVADLERRLVLVRQADGRCRAVERAGPGTSLAIFDSSVKDEKSERARKLAEMQSNASKLDEDREQRLAAVAERERMNGEADETARMRSSRYGGKGDFVMGLNRKAGDLDLAERMRRGRGAMKQESEE
ncbi:MAG: RNA-splicing factor [Caeruleum heppii]|nr:MAG: RNA-splicing factor [Caeruleum heppii]